MSSIFWQEEEIKMKVEDRSKLNPIRELALSNE